MKVTFTLVSILFACFSLNASAFYLESSPSVTSFTKVKRMMLVKAQIDDQEGYFLIDTGADDLILNKRHFGDYESITNLGNYKDVNGKKKKAEYLYVRSFKWGALQRANFYTQQLDFTAIETVLDEEILGLMGFEVFRHIELTIDYDELEITLTKLDGKGLPVSPVYENSPAYTLNFMMNGHLAILQADYGGESPVSFGLDSGSTINILDRKWQKDLAGASHRKNKISFMGANSSRKRRHYFTVNQLEIQDQFAIRYWKAAIGKFEHFEDTDIYLDGLLGINFFQIGRVSINYRQKQINVWPNENAIRWRYVNLNENLVQKNEDKKKKTSAND